jgi:ferritin-like protein
VGLWNRIQEAVGAAWADMRRPRVDDRTRLIMSLAEAWQAERRISLQIRQTIPGILYEHLRQSLNAMAHEDEHHAQLLQERLTDAGVTPAECSQAGAGLTHNLPDGPWKRLRYILAEKRQLYECYHQEVTATDDPGLQSLLRHLRDGEERHQDQLIAMLMQLDAHVHEAAL